MTPHDKKQLVRALQPVLARVRRDISAVKTPDGSRWTDEPITTHAMERHVNGGPARGACPIKEGESVTMLAVLDLDSHKGATSWADMLGAACVLRDALALWGMQVTAFRSSGGRGIHLLLLWDDPQDAYSVRQAIFAAMALTPYSSGAKGVAAGQVEVFPKQDEIGPGEKGNQFILPLAGASEPLDLDLGIPLGREAVIGMQWAISAPVPVLQRPERPDRTGEGFEPIERVREALFSIYNGDDELRRPDYETWWKLGAAVHAATGASEEGRQVFVEWSEQYSAFDDKFFEDRVWAYLKDPGKRDNAVGKGTLYGLAKEHGWTTATPDGFEDVPGTEDEPEMAGSIDSTVVPPGEEMSLTAGKDGRDLPAFVRKDNGAILATVGNVLKACRSAQVLKWRIAHDAFRDEIMVAETGELSWRAFGDADYTRLREYLEANGFEPIGKEMMRDVVHLVAQEHRFDSAILWLESLPQTSKPRIDTFLVDFMGCEDNPYTRAVSRYMWTALAGRVMAPGCQADMAPVFIGDQGSGKTTAVKTLVPAPEHYVEVDFNTKEEDLSRKMRGKLVGELGELRGMRLKEQDYVKAFVSRTHEEWVPKFKEFGNKFPRRLLLIGTTNNERFLVDDTGNRRWLPVMVGKVDIEGLRAVVLELWAEARELWRANGVLWQDAQELAREVHEDHEVRDSWLPIVDRWLDQTDFDGVARIVDRPFLTTSMVLTECLKIDAARQGRAEEMRAANVLKKLGFDRNRKMIKGEREYHFFLAKIAPPCPTSDLPF